MILDIKLDDKIYEQLDSMSNERGITVKELIRWIIGDYLLFSHPRLMPLSTSPPCPLPSEATSTTEKVIKLSNLIMKSLLAQGSLKCPNCTLSLTVEALEQGKCSNCGAEI